MAARYPGPLAFSPSADRLQSIILRPFLSSRDPTPISIPYYLPFETAHRFGPRKHHRGEPDHGPDIFSRIGLSKSISCTGSEEPLRAETDRELDGVEGVEVEELWAEG